MHTSNYPITLDLPAIIGKQPFDIHGISLATPNRAQFCLDMFIANKHVRQGVAPTGESHRMIEAIIKTAIANDAPIPCLTTYGAIKAGNILSERIDLAEMMALHTLKLLDERIRVGYPPGIDLTIRMEDLAEPYNISYDKRNVDRVCARFVKSFKALVEAMNLDFITVRAESEMVAVGDWIHWTNFHAGMFASYLAKTRSVASDKLGRTEVYNNLTYMGWSGTIDHPIREWFAARYKRIYGNMNVWDFEFRLAHYLAGIMTRTRFNASGVSQPSIYVSLSGPLPFNFPQPRLYYRTKAGCAHINPWCAVGFIDMIGPSLKLVSARDSDYLTWTPITINGAEVWAPYQPSRVVHD